ncbi:MAG: L-histidine N(alpha)-methyltransferase [Elusimicrobia bacterium]|nr:L-histidine N(alpha)-methyltransferase [Elusimicrobiota bacterium]
MITTASPISDRAFQVRVGPTIDKHVLAADVEAGLSSTPKRLPCAYFYDTRGTQLFQQITRRPEYYLPRAEMEILTEHADDIAAAVGRGTVVLELGCGAGPKSKLLLESLMRRQKTAVYCPIDVSESAIRQNGAALMRELPGLSIEAELAEYDDGLDRFFSQEPAPTLVAFLGSSLGNMHREEALGFLARLRRRARPFDMFLLGLDLEKEPEVINAAYNDAAGLTAQFNKNILRRINKELGGEFDEDAFDHVARYNESKGRVEMHLKSRAAGFVRIEGLDRYVEFRAGETIWTESCYKYSRRKITEMCALTGWTPLHHWEDGRGWFTALLLAPAPDRGLFNRRAEPSI